MCLIFLQGEVDRFPIENTGAGGSDQDLHGGGWERENVWNIENKNTAWPRGGFFTWLITAVMLNITNSISLL